MANTPPPGPELFFPWRAEGVSPLLSGGLGGIGNDSPHVGHRLETPTELSGTSTSVWQKGQGIWHMSVST
jgi:hypothetical protein